MRLANVGIQLQPNVAQLVGRFVGVGNLLGSGQQLSLVIYFNVDAVINLLLPVTMTWSPRCDAIIIWRRQNFFQLSKLVNLPELSQSFFSRRLCVGKRNKRSTNEREKTTKSKI